MNSIMAFCLLLAAFSISLNTFASNKINSKLSNESAEILLKKILPSNCFFSADFLQNRDMKNIPLALTSSGKIFFSCDHGLLWKSEKPILETLIYSTPNLNYRITQNSSIEVLVGQKHDYLSKLLLSILSNDIKNITNEFTIIKNPNNGAQSISLIPNNDFVRKGLDSIQLSKTIATLPGTLSTPKEEIFITITDTQNQSTRITINKIQPHFLDANKGKNKQVSSNCNTLINETISCNILENPYSVEIINSNN